MTDAAPKPPTKRVKQRRVPSRLARALAPSVSLLLSLTATGCGLQHSEYTIRADSLAVSPGPSQDTMRVRVYGFAARNGCGKLDRVEMSVREDTAIRRFVGETKRSFCTQKPIPLDYLELVYVPAGARIVYAVQQPDGTKLVSIISPP